MLPFTDPWLGYKTGSSSTKKRLEKSGELSFRKHWKKLNFNLQNNKSITV